MKFLFPVNIIPDMFKGRTLKLKLFGILLSIDIDVSVRRLSMIIDDKISNSLSLTIMRTRNQALRVADISWT